MSTIWTPAAPLHHLLELKRSKFHCHIERADSSQAANLLIARLRQQYPDANHVCSAYIAGVSGNTTALGCSDDGEPNGCAGKPMLNVLMHSEVSFVVAAVARIFGGTKLGTGGLARAYGGVVSEGMARLDLEEKRILTSARYTLPFAFEAQARHLLDKFDGVLESVAYSNEILMHISIDEERLPVFTADMKNASGGQCVLLPCPVTDSE